MHHGDQKKEKVKPSTLGHLDTLPPNGMPEIAPEDVQFDNAGDLALGNRHLAKTTARPLKHLFNLLG